MAGFLNLNRVTAQQAAEAMGISLGRVQSIIKGVTYPSPDELRMFSGLCNDMPYQVMFEPEMLAYVDNWPPPRGGAAQAAEIKRLREKAGE
ncbi:helix-turn-helix domain-containing protein [Leifsonia xyli]|uniref:helix-turn-helix domain-containing protein n=1 Tax=Leifsonia xyli TaxID=1575 RepID=UPI003D67DED9